MLSNLPNSHRELLVECVGQYWHDGVIRHFTTLCTYTWRKLGLYIIGIVVPPNTAPPFTASPQYRHPSSSPKKNVNGTAKFLFCHYNIAVRVWGLVKGHLFSSVTYVARAPKYRRYPNTAAFTSDRAVSKWSDCPNIKTYKLYFIVI